MADEFIAKNAPNVTDAFVNYLKPLLGSGMPEVFRLEAERVGKILKK
jgi:6-phosphofructokinase 1